MEKYVLILAGGKGRRMHSDTPKQFLEVAGFPLLMHTFFAFDRVDDFRFVLVLPDEHTATWQELCHLHRFEVPHRLAPAGPKRFHSVKSGLQQVPDGTLVAIHDGVRPLVSPEVIRRCFDLAGRKGNAVPVLELEDSVRTVSASLNKALDRSSLRRVQTPQVFRSELIKNAYNRPYDESFTDDASLLESTGVQIHLTEGNPENIKITTPFDLQVAAALLGNA